MGLWEVIIIVKFMGEVLRKLFFWPASRPKLTLMLMSADVTICIE
jgi:hypothetical protein